MNGDVVLADGKNGPVYVNQDSNDEDYEVAQYAGNRSTTIRLTRIQLFALIHRLLQLAERG